MELTVIASSSEGNAYLLHSKREALMIEAGAPFAGVLEAADYDVAKIQGCLVTHEHGDHAGRVKEVLAYGLPVYTSNGTLKAILPKLKGEYKPKGIPTDEAGDYAPPIPRGLRGLPLRYQARRRRAFRILYLARGHRRDPICYGHLLYKADICRPSHGDNRM